MNGDSEDMHSVNLEGQLEAMTLAHEQKQLVSKLTDESDQSSH